MDYIEISDMVYDLATGETTVVKKQLELIIDPKPDVPDGYRLETWTEESDTQLLQHWNLVPVEATPADYLSALNRLGVQT